MKGRLQDWIRCNKRSVSVGRFRVVPNLMAKRQALDLRSVWIKEGIACFDVEKFRSIRI